MFLRARLGDKHTAAVEQQRFIVGGVVNSKFILCPYWSI